jgi:hypothetical protein
MSVAAIHARIAEIQARITAPAPSGNGAAFGAQLSVAMTETADPAAALASGAAPTLDPTALVRPPALQSAAATTSSGKVGPPAELLAYGNGKIPPEALAEIGDGDHRLWAPAAEKFNAMRQAAAADGISFGVTDSYRSYEAQVDVAERKGLYSQGGLAATPGTSQHGWGMALDLDLDPAAQEWMRANGSRYGFVEDVPREPWHWTFRGAAA